MQAAAASAATVLIAAALALCAPAPVIAAGSGGAPFGTAAQAPAPADPAPTGGVDPAQPSPTTPVPSPEPAPGLQATATIGPDGLASAPEGAPAQVKAIIAAGNQIARKAYLWGGGHRRWIARGYDCSGSVSYALHGAGLLDAPLVSGGFARWGDAGPGTWVTLYANAGHVFMTVAGLRFDTYGQRAAGTRWQPAQRRIKSMSVRHPSGL